MKFSNAFIPTLRQAPNDAEVISHKLLMRAGMIRRVANGIYEFLPLGLRSLQKVERVVRAALNDAGCEEVQMPHLVPAELWQQSGRWQKYGKELLRITDRHEREYCFGPTHEEVICDMVRGDLKSYRDFPLHLYQIQTKFRDEIRPRFGLMRGREFLMKDGYSFHTSVEDLDREYNKMRATYLTIFKNCGLACRAVDADTGAIGGSSSHEFMVLADTGEDAIASCNACDYAANLEKATWHKSTTTQTPTKDREEVHTPKQKKINDVSALLGISPSQMIKTLVYRADAEFVIVCLSGNREVNDIKLKNAIGCDEVRLASDEDVFKTTGVPTGFLGPIGMKTELKIYFDHSIATITDGATGANKPDYHLAHVATARDLKISHFVDVASVVAGDTCPVCTKGTLNILRGIEVGHIFKLGTRYSEPMNVKYLDTQGQEQTAIMGTYGIGVSRTLASCIEQNNDAAGIIWPKALAPFEVIFITMGNVGARRAVPLPIEEQPFAEASEKLYQTLKQNGIDVLWDNRDERAGVKFNDADLIGFPLQIIFGKRGLEKGEVEYKIRKTGVKGSFPLENTANAIQELLKEIV